MRRLYIATLALFIQFIIINTASAQFGYMGAYNWEGVPSYLVNPSDTISQALLTKIAATLPESYSVPIYHPDYLSQPLNDLKLAKEADVWITFIGEGATFRNGLGFYTYDLSTPPASVPLQSTIKVIFPNCSVPGDGGGLNKGSKVFLGHFPANTGIGMVLMADGYDGSIVGNGQGVYYSTPSFNPETSAGLKRHHVLIFDTLSKNIILGFEDINRSYGNCDQDFNDVLFYLKASPADAWDTTGMPVLNTPGSGAGSGNNGGLESESLGDIVSKWKHARILKGTDGEVNYKNFPVFNGAADIRFKTTAGEKLVNFVPANLESGDLPRVTSPTDLLQLTGAIDVISVDYVRNDKAKAVVLGLLTTYKPYSHTKSICDRFRGAKLLAVNSINIKGYDFARYTLQQFDGKLEYAIAFVIGSKQSRPNYQVQTNWLLSEYSTDDTLYNFQVWATQPHYTVKLVIDIIDKFITKKPLTQLNTSFTLPGAYMMEGRRNKEYLDIYINNKSNATNAKIVFEERINENANISVWEQSFMLNPGRDNIVRVPIKDGYEYAGKLFLNNVAADGFYMADGHWGLDYDGQYTSIIQFKPNNDLGRVYNDEEYPVYRNVTLKAETKDYISIFKSIRSGFEKADLREYHSLKFFAKGEGKATIKLFRDSISDTKKQYKVDINLVPEGKNYAISFEDFSSTALAEDIYPVDIEMLDFTVESAGGVKKSVDLLIDRMAFSKERVLSNKSLQSKSITLTPNPSNGNFSCQFASDDERTVILNVSDLSGRVVYSKEIKVARGFNKADISVPNYISGSILVVSVKAEDVKYDAAKLLILK